MAVRFGLYLAALPLRRGFERLHKVGVMTEIPQSLHVRQNHPLAPRLIVRLDDIEQPRVIEYNIPLGRLVRYEIDKDGDIVMRGEDAAIEILFGDVTVELRSES